MLSMVTPRLVETSSPLIVSNARSGDIEGFTTSQLHVYINIIFSGSQEEAPTYSV